MSELPVIDAVVRLSGPLLEHLGRRLRADAAGELERAGLRPRHLIALTMLRDHGETSQADLAATLHVDRTNLVGLLNELEAQGLVERRRSPEDRRRHTVTLTDAGHERLAAVSFALAATEARILQRLDGDERAQLHALLRKAAEGTFAGACDATPPTDC